MPSARTAFSGKAKAGIPSCSALSGQGCDDTAIVHTSTGLCVAPARRAGGHAVGDGGENRSGLAAIDGGVDDEHGVCFFSRQRHFNGAAVLLRSGGGDQIDRVADARVGGKKPGQRGPRLRREFDDRQVRGFTRVGGQDRRAASVA